MQTSRANQIQAMRQEHGSYAKALDAAGHPGFTDADAHRIFFEWNRLAWVGTSLHSIVEDGIKMGVIG